MSDHKFSGAGLKRRTSSSPDQACADMSDLESEEDTVVQRENESSVFVPTEAFPDYLLAVEAEAYTNHQRNKSIVNNFKVLVMKHTEDLLCALYKINDDELAEIQSRVDSCSKLGVQREQTNSDKLILESKIGAHISMLSSLLKRPNAKANVTADDDSTSSC
jgi:hypothetical protein